MVEDDLELACIEWFKELGWEYVNADDLLEKERAGSTQEVILSPTLRQALIANNPELTADAIDKAMLAIKDMANSDKSLIEANEAFYVAMRDGIRVEVEENGEPRGIRVQVFNWTDPLANSWVVTNQFTVRDKATSRPDMVAFINGLPMVIIELKNPANEKADIWQAYHQIDGYKEKIPSLFRPSLANVISDGVVARIGSLTAREDWYTPWRGNEGAPLSSDTPLELEVLIKGFFNRNTILTYFKHFVAYKREGGHVIKIIAGYHQFYGVQLAVERAIDAVVNKKDGKGGVVWFTQGSGKSLLALFYAAMLREQEEFNNPTIVVVTDRNDLDGQLFEDFANCPVPLRGTPVQATSREDLKEKLSSIQAGGVFFTTIQRFPPTDPTKEAEPLCDRENVIVICDEAHRTQYGFTSEMEASSGKLKYGMATYMRQSLPNAVYLGLTGTPISDGERDTESVFGSYIDFIYDVQASQVDGNTVPLHYEPRIISLKVAADEELEALNEEVDKLEADAGQGVTGKTASDLTRLESIAMAEGRLRTLAEDLLAHWELRKEAQVGKAMVVALSRKTAVALYDEIVQVKREQGDDTWHSDDISQGKIKVIMTSGASDSAELRAHATSKSDKERLKNRVKDENDELEIIIVRDMWLTGTNLPILNTMYVDKPMKGHDLMQAIARVNRVWKDKPGGLIVDYVGIGAELKSAIATYTRHKGTGKPIEQIEQAVEVLKRHIATMRELMGEFDYSEYRDPSKALALLPAAMDYVLTYKPEVVDGVNVGMKAFMDLTLNLTKSQGLAGTHKEALEFREEIAFFQAVQSALAKMTRAGAKLSPSKKEAALREIVDKSVLSEGVTNIYADLGVENPDMSMLSEEFLKKVQEIPQKDLAAELLQRLLEGKITYRGRKNKPQKKKYSELLTKAIERYQSRSIDSANFIKSLVDMANNLENETPPEGMTEEDFTFLLALRENEEAAAALSEDALQKLAVNVAAKLKEKVFVDWQHRQGGKAGLRAAVKLSLTLGRYRSPAKEADRIVDIILDQAEVLTEQWVAEKAAENPDDLN